MNSYERFTARLRGEPVDHTPNFDILMARAARHIGTPLSNYYLDYHVLVDANLAAAADFHVDILQAISDQVLVKPQISGWKSTFRKTICRSVTSR